MYLFSYLSHFLSCQSTAGLHVTRCIQTGSNLNCCLRGCLSPSNVNSTGNLMFKKYVSGYFHVKKKHPMVTSLVIWLSKLVVHGSGVGGPCLPAPLSQADGGGLCGRSLGWLVLHTKYVLMPVSLLLSLTSSDKARSTRTKPLTVWAFCWVGRHPCQWWECVLGGWMWKGPVKMLSPSPRPSSSPLIPLTTSLTTTVYGSDCHTLCALLGFFPLLLQIDTCFSVPLTARCPLGPKMHHVTNTDHRPMTANTKAVF